MDDDFITVKVGSMYYRITADEDADYVRGIAKQANEMLAELKNKHGSLSDAAAAVLALLNALDQGEKRRFQDSAFTAHVEDVERALAESQAELLRLRERIWEIKKDLLYYRNLCEMYEARLSELPALPTRESGSKERVRPLDKIQRSIDELELFDLPAGSEQSHLQTGEE